MTRLLSILAFGFVVLTGCKNEAILEDGMNYYGAQIDVGDEVDLGDLNTQNLGDEPVSVKFKGTIGSVCKKKGCWMTMNDSESGSEVFVRFKDYEFFVPMDADGLEAIVEGELSQTVTSVDELRHYAEDSGQSHEEIAQITEPKVELKLMAEGVIIYN